MIALYDEGTLRRRPYSEAFGLPCFVWLRGPAFPTVYWSGGFETVVNEECVHGLLRGIGRNTDEILEQRYAKDV